ncbi:MAG: DUF4906 domain-containing protein [Bacteroidales bacterium]|nr:DUF4906 domain-containing protein [Bacteroidales bacterium]
MKHTISKTIASVLALAALFSSCNKFEGPQMQSDPEQRYNINVTLGGAAVEIETKLTGDASTVSTNEAKINSLQVLVFRGDFLDAYGTANSNSVSVSCTAGSRTIYAVVNGPNLSGVTSLSALESTMVDLSANSANSFVMSGKTVTTLPGTKSVTVPVSRMVSRIVLKKITRNFTATSLQGLTFKVDSIYVVNAAGSFNYAMNAAPGKWYNQDKDRGDLPALLRDTPGATIANNASYSTPHYFYVMPNPGSSKTTKLVIVATLGTQKYYYPVSLPALQHNKSYEIAGVTVKRGGSDNPDTPVTSDDISFSVTVAGWTTSNIEEQIM